MPGVALLDLGSSSTRMLLLDEETKQAIWSKTLEPCLSVKSATSACEQFHAAISGAGGLSAVACTTFVGNFIQHQASGKSCNYITTYATSHCSDMTSATSKLLAQLCGALPCSAYLTGNFSAVGADCVSLDCLGSWVLQKTLNVPRHISLCEAAWLGVLPWDAASPRVVSSVPGTQALPLLQRALSLLPAVQSEPMEGKLIMDKVLHVIPCIGDGAAASEGTAHPAGTASKPIVSISIGTSAAVRCILPLNSHTKSLLHAHAPQLVTGSGGWVYRIAPDAVLVGAAMTDGAAALQDVCNMLVDAFTLTGPGQGAGSADAAARGSMHRCMDQLASRSELLPAAGATLPLSGGERAPGMRGGGAHGIVSGISRRGGLGEALLSRVQGVCCQLEQLLALLLPLLGVNHAHDCCIVGSGGALEKGALWRRVLANVLQAPVLVAAGQTQSAGAGAPHLHAAASEAKMGLETTSLGLCVHALWEVRREKQRGSAGGDAAAAATPSPDGTPSGSSDSSSSSFAAAAAAAQVASCEEGSAFTEWLCGEFPHMPPLRATAPDAGAPAAQAWGAARQRYAQLYDTAEASGLLPPRVSQEQSHTC